MKPHYPSSHHLNLSASFLIPPSSHHHLCLLKASFSPFSHRLFHPLIQPYLTLRSPLNCFTCIYISTSTSAPIPVRPPTPLSTSANTFHRFTIYIYLLTYPAPLPGRILHRPSTLYISPISPTNSTHYLSKLRSLLPTSTFINLPYSALSYLPARIPLRFQYYSPSSVYSALVFICPVHDSPCRRSTQRAHPPLCHPTCTFTTASLLRPLLLILQPPFVPFFTFRMPIHTRSSHFIHLFPCHVTKPEVQRNKSGVPPSASAMHSVVPVPCTPPNAHKNAPEKGSSKFRGSSLFTN